jgi:hypothetical protein
METVIPKTWLTSKGLKMDINKLALLGTSAPLILKLLGPTADYLGEALRHQTERGMGNLKNIFDSATRKLGDKIETEGTVPPKVIKGILIEGPYCDDSLTAEYFGGVLASSRSGVSRDDRGASLIALLSRLSTYQIRTHYIFYRVIKDLLNGENINPNVEIDKAETYIPWDTYGTAMEFSKSENPDILLPHILFGLRKEDLIVGSFIYGGQEFIKDHHSYNVIEGEEGIIFTPSVLGIELFLWAHGEANYPLERFFKDYKLQADIKMNIKPGYRRTQE